MSDASRSSATMPKPPSGTSGPSSRSVPSIRPRRYTDLAESYFRGGRRAEARKQTLAALEIAPSYERAQDLLLKIAEDRP